jgi:hypothetical protein
MEKILVNLVGIVPLILHNGELANSLNQWSKMIKEITSKRKKTEADINQISEYEWYGGLYYDDLIGPYIPGEMVDACLRDAGKLRKRGKDIKRAVQTMDAKIPLKYKGPRNIDDLWKSGNFVDTRMAGVNNGRISRTRPIFLEWSITCNICFNADVINKTDLVDIITDAGMFACLGDYRPRYGKFDVEVVNGQ